MYGVQFQSAAKMAAEAFWETCAGVSGLRVPNSTDRADSSCGLMKVERVPSIADSSPLSSSLGSS